MLLVCSIQGHKISVLKCINNCVDLDTSCYLSPRDLIFCFILLIISIFRLVSFSTNHNSPDTELVHLLTRPCAQ
jgi:hypothetical protein